MGVSGEIHHRRSSWETIKKKEELSDSDIRKTQTSKGKEGGITLLEEDLFVTLSTS